LNVNIKISKSFYDNVIPDALARHRIDSDMLHAEFQAVTGILVCSYLFIRIQYSAS